MSDEINYNRKIETDDAEPKALEQVAGELASGNFYSLMPDTVLASVEEAGARTTGLCYALNSLENRVYEIELEDRSRVVAKFYRPGRWSFDAIMDEHRMLAALVDQEIPCCAPTPFSDGETIHTTQDGIFFSIFPKIGGRSPDELHSAHDHYAQIGRLLARIHNVGAGIELKHRPDISPKVYGTDRLELILSKASIAPGVSARYVAAVQALVVLGDQMYRGVECIPLHGDCHRANLLHDQQWFFLDFDDMGIGPAVQDLWLLLPGRASECAAELEQMLEGYEQFREIDPGTIRLIELLRGLRYVRYAGWVAERWDDPAFKRAFPAWGSDRYWEGQTADVMEQVALSTG